MRELHGDRDLEETRAHLLNDEQYLDAEGRMWLLFVRIVPKLLLKVHAIALSLSVFGGATRTLDHPEEVDEGEQLLKAILNAALRDLQQEIKSFIGMRGRGGSKAKLGADKRKSLHARYDELHQTAKTMKRYYNDLYKRFDESRSHHGYTHQEWQKFWRAHVAAIYPDYDQDFLALFARRDKPSASKVAYLQLHKETGHKISYLPRLIRESRGSTRKASPRKKRTMKTAE